MASWMMHLRVADAVMDKLDGLSPREFVMGNQAPDSGIPNANGIDYTPSSVISHFKVYRPDGTRYINVPDYIARYFNPEMRKSYSIEPYSFFLGYLVHLLTDALWNDQVYKPTLGLYPEECAADRKNLIKKIKSDWYEQDLLYLAKHPNLRTYAIFRQCNAFPNRYIAFFPENAFDERRKYVIEYYQQKHSPACDHLYLTTEQADNFVLTCSQDILQYIKNL